MRSRQVEHSTRPFMRRYVAIERSMRMLQPAQTNSGIPIGSTFPPNAIFKRWLVVLNNRGNPSRCSDPEEFR